MNMKINSVIITAGILSLGVSGCATAERNVQGVEMINKHGFESVRIASEARPILPIIGEESTLQDYLRYAAINNPGLEAAFNRWKASLERITQARSLPDPQLSYGYCIVEVETRVGPQRQKLELSQMFPWFGKLRLRESMAAKAAEADYSMYQAKKLKLFYGVKNSFYEYYYLARTINITKTNMKLLEDLEKVARRKYSAGGTDHAVVIKAHVELGRLEDRLKTLNDFRKPIVAKLNAALNRKSSESLPWPKSIEKQQGEMDEASLLDQLQQNNPELKALDSRIERRKDAIGLAKKDYFPDFMLGVGWIDTGDALNPDLEGSGDDPLIGMIGINIPIWFRKYRAAENEAKSLHLAASKQRQNRENTLSADVSMALFKYQDATRKIDLYGKSLLPKARQSLEVSKQAFETGKLDFLTLIDAERLLLEFELSYERALADQAKKLAEIEMLTGKEISRQGDGNEKE